MSENKEDVIYEMDGDQWCCHRKDFTNLMESPAGFGYTQEEALADLLKNEKRQL